MMRIRCSPSPVLGRTLWIRSKVPRGRPYSSSARTDDYGIPLTPTWSVTELLSSSPKANISSQALKHLHDLAALIPPAEGTPEHAKLKDELSELVRLVEGVKLVDTQGVTVLTRWDKKDADKQNLSVVPKDFFKGQDLLWHALRIQNGFYLVDSDRSEKVS